MQKPTAELSRRTRNLLDEADRLPLITGLSSDQILDLILRALNERKAACAAITKHIENHNCHAGHCEWPLSDCSACK